jgi:hypothetical protein
MKKELTWEEHIEQCLQLGVTKKSYCEENNLSYQLFFYHQRKLKQREPSAGFTEIILDHAMTKAYPSRESLDAVLQLQFANGNTLFFSEHLLDRIFQLCQEQ